jgi:dephospho-CoA kinase
MADHVIDNSGSLEDTRAQIVALVERLTTTTATATATDSSD